MMCLGMMAQNILEETTIKRFDFRYIPKHLTSDGKTILYSMDGEDDETGITFNILDENFDEVKTFKSSSTMYFHEIIKRRMFVENYLDTGEFLGEGYTGDWVTERDYDLYCSSCIRPCIYNLDNSTFDEGQHPLSQTLFNNDDKYEYLEVVFKQCTEKEENDRDFDGMIDEEITNIYNKIIGFKIVQDDGTVLQTINIEPYNLYVGNEPSYRFREHMYLYTINGKNYFGYFDEDYTFYSINNDGGSSGIIHKVGSPIKVSVRPTIVNRNEPISVALDGDNAESSRVTVNDASGRTVYRTTIPAGQKQTNIDTSKFGNGLNVVTVQRNGSKVDSHKVIVK